MLDFQAAKQFTNCLSTKKTAGSDFHLNSDPFFKHSQNPSIIIPQVWVAILHFFKVSALARKTDFIKDSADW